MPIRVLLKIPMPRTSVLIRLTADDTRFLADRIDEAIRRHTGVNLIMENLKGAACLISSAERGQQISLNAYTDAIAYRVQSPMRGYNGPWSHVELVLEPEGGRQQLREFVEQLEERWDKN